jgi:hypothetical protein
MQHQPRNKYEQAKRDRIRYNWRPRFRLCGSQPISPSLSERLKHSRGRTSAAYILDFLLPQQPANIQVLTVYWLARQQPYQEGLLERVRQLPDADQIPYRTVRKITGLQTLPSYQWERTRSTPFLREKHQDTSSPRWQLQRFLQVAIIVGSSENCCTVDPKALKSCLKESFIE